jgi:hypothetical protein
VPAQSTAPVVADHATERRSRWVRRGLLAGFTLLVALGLTGLLGVRSHTATADGADGTRVEVTYPQVARPALAVPFHVRISRPGGFDEQIEVRITRTWLESFDENGVIPAPAEESSDGDDVVWTFDPPDGEVFTLTLDTRVEPGVQWQRHGTTTVTIGTERIDVDHTMWVFP